MTHYLAVLEKEEGTLYGVYFPDLPGCTTAAETSEEVIRLAAEAARLWAEDAIESGETLPVARTVEELRCDADVNESVRRGAVFIAVPLLVDSGRPARANISLDRSLLDAIDKAAKARGLTRSAFLASAAREKIIAGT